MAESKDFEMMDHHVTMVSSISGRTNTLVLNYKEVDMIKFQRGMHVQDAFPYMSKEHREFLLSGITPEEWNEHFGLPEEE